MNSLCLDWLPETGLVSLLPAGKWWDAIRVPYTLAVDVLDRLDNETGAVIEDPWGGLIYWLVPLGSASCWEMPKPSGIKVLRDSTYVVVPGLGCSNGPRWLNPPVPSSILTRPDRLHDALARATAALALQSPAEAYRMLISHYAECTGCAYEIEPCIRGRRLRQAWVGVRWS